MSSYLDNHAKGKREKQDDEENGEEPENISIATTECIHGNQCPLTLMAMQRENGKNRMTRRMEKNQRTYPQHPMSPSRSTSIWSLPAKHIKELSWWFVKYFKKQFVKILYRFLASSVCTTALTRFHTNSHQTIFICIYILYKYNILYGVTYYINITFFTGWHCRLSPRGNIVDRGGAEVMLSKGWQSTMSPRKECDINFIIPNVPFLQQISSLWYNAVWHSKLSPGQLTNQIAGN